MISRANDSRLRNRAMCLVFMIIITRMIGNRQEPISPCNLSAWYFVPTDVVLDEMGREMLCRARGNDSKGENRITKITLFAATQSLTEL